MMTQFQESIDISTMVSQKGVYPYTREPWDFRRSWPSYGHKKDDKSQGEEQQTKTKRKTKKQKQ